jgi:hypothetical protein
MSQLLQIMMQNDHESITDDQVSNLGCASYLAMILPGLKFRPGSIAVKSPSIM